MPEPRATTTHNQESTTMSTSPHEPASGPSLYARQQSVLRSIVHIMSPDYLRDQALPEHVEIEESARAKAVRLELERLAEVDPTVRETLALGPAPREPLRLTSVSLRLDVTVLPRNGQSASEAAAEMTAVLAEYLTDDDKPFFEDYGVRRADVEANHSNGELTTWGGYEGPFALSVVLSRRDAQGREVPVASSTW